MAATTTPRGSGSPTPNRVPQPTVSVADATARLAALRDTRFEVVPMRGVEDQVEHLPTDAVVTVTASPTRGLEPTITLAIRLAAAGHTVVPHLSARLFVDRAHVADVLDRVTRAGITELFVPAGDPPRPVGPFAGAPDVLPVIRDLGFTGAIGITGYPESHHFIDDATTIAAMSAKAPHADTIVSQICFDPAVTDGWVRAVRARGVDLPIRVGIPGVVHLRRLMQISIRVGLGESVKYLVKQHGVATRLLTGYDPGHLVDDLAATVADPELGVTGWHLFTFNAIETTVAWWRERLAVAAEDLRLARERDPGSSTDATSPSPPTDPEPGP